MPTFKVSRKANNDLRSIGRYTEKKWGKAQRTKYLRELDQCFQTLADNPHLGRDINDLRQGYHCYSYQSHIIFYVITDTEIRIVRILHNRMDYERHL